MPARTLVPARAKAGRAAGAFLASAAVVWCVWRGSKPSKNPLPESGKGNREEDGRSRWEETPAPVLLIPPPKRIAEPLSGLPQQAADTPHITRLPEIPVNLLPEAAVRRRSRAFFISLLFHCCFIWLLSLPFDVEEEWKDPAPPLNLHLLVLTPLTYRPEKSSTPRDTKEQTHNTGALPKKSLLAPRPLQNEQNAGPDGENGSERRAFSLPPLPHAAPGEHTLVQPDIPPEIRPRENMGVPEALIWAQQEARNLLIVPGPASPAAFPDAPPVIDVAAQELKPPDVAVRATPATTMPQLPVPRASSSPARVASPETETGIPETTSNSAAETSAGHLISVADVPLPPEARIVVPSVTQVAALKNPESKNLSSQSSGAGGFVKNDDAARAAQKSTEHQESAAADKAATASQVAASASAGPKASVGQLANGQPEGVQSVAALSTADGLTRISRPPTGHHASVVLGAQPSAAYPESAGVLTGKIVYTVYLQMELRKNWILQFCLSGSGEQQPQPNGGVPSIDAPWPFLMLRPPMERLSGDYTLVHGVINPAGRFEQLALVIPDNSAKDLLEALRQWEFRPASRDGKAVAVEFLLILPHPQE